MREGMLVGFGGPRIIITVLNSNNFLFIHKNVVVKHDPNDVILAFITSDKEYTDERPATTCSGGAVTRRAEIDFLFF